jgi:hypothetical protein
MAQKMGKQAGIGVDCPIAIVTDTHFLQQLLMDTFFS